MLPLNSLHATVVNMKPTESAVKPVRRYNAIRRQEQAAAGRAATIREAERLFLERGFARTTIAAIASAAGVSVETIFKSFGGKPGLLRAVCDAALAGDGPVHAEVRSDGLQAALHDPREIIRGWGRLVSEVSPRISPLLLLAREAAAGDEEIARFLTGIEQERLERMTHNARNLAAANHLRADLTVRGAAELMWTYTSPEIYDLLVNRLSWTVDELGDFVARALIAALLPPEDAGAGT